MHIHIYIYIYIYIQLQHMMLNEHLRIRGVKVEPTNRCDLSHHLLISSKRLFQFNSCSKQITVVKLAECFRFSFLITWLQKLLLEFLVPRKVSDQNKKMWFSKKKNLIDFETYIGVLIRYKKIHFNIFIDCKFFLKSF